MFKTSVILVALCLIVSSKANEDTEAYITKYASQINEDGSYAYEYGTSNQIEVEESGVGSVFAKGTVKYSTPDGQPIYLEYVADVNGYQPIGDHLPTPPPTPDYVFRALKYIEDHPFERVQPKK